MNARHSAVQVFVVGAAMLLTAWAAPQSAPEPSAYFESDGFKIHYESFGAGPPLVLVHGWGANTQSWIAPGWIDALKSKRLLISLEPRGFGKSDKPHDAAAYSYSA